jgi:hypothetical protein
MSFSSDYVQGGSTEWCDDVVASTDTVTVMGFWSIAGLVTGTFAVDSDSDEVLQIVLHIFLLLLHSITRSLTFWDKSSSRALTNFS